MTQTTTVDIALPVLNEEFSLERQVRQLLDRLEATCDYGWSLTIVDNGSTDATWDIAARLVSSEPRMRALRLERPGRGGALKAAWGSSTADIMAYMDIDLSTDLDALGPLLDAIARDGADIAIGSRLASGAQVTRSLRREFISHIYNLIARAALRYGVQDAQCGFKAVTRAVAVSVVPAVEDDSWFFDTELLALARRRNLRIAELPVRWVEDDDSRVRIVNTALDDLRGIWRLARHPHDAGAPRAEGASTTARIAESVAATLVPPTLATAHEPVLDGHGGKPLDARS